MYCDARIGWNSRESRAVRWDGLAALKVGVPVAVGGFLVALIRSKVFPGLAQASEIAGGVVMWIGLWFPLDTILFTPLSFGRESRALRRLHEASFVPSIATSGD